MSTDLRRRVNALSIAINGYIGDSMVIGVVIRPDCTREQALERIRLAKQRSPVVYIANLARISGLERNP